MLLPFEAAFLFLSLPTTLDQIFVKTIFIATIEFFVRCMVDECVCTNLIAEL